MSSGTAKQAVTILGGRGLLRLTQFVAFLVLARVLTPAEFGWFGIVTTAISLAALIGSLGLRQSFAFEIGQGRLEANEALATSLLLWPVLTAVSASVITALYATSVPGIETSAAALLIVVGVAGAILHALVQGIFLGKGTIWAFTLSETMPRMVMMFLVVLMAWLLNLTLTSSLWIQASSYILVLPVMFIIAGRGGGPFKPVFRRIGPMLAYGLVFAFNLFLVTLCARVSMFIIQWLDGADAAGQFFAASRINEIFLEATTALGLVLFSQATRGADHDSTVRRGVRLAAWLFWFFLGVGGLVAIAAPIVLSMLLGHQYESATPALQVLALSLAPTAAAKMIYPSLAGSGRPFFGTPVLLLSLGLNVGLALLLIPDLGVVGGAVAFVLGQFLVLLGYALTCRVKYGIPIHSAFWPEWRRLRDVDWAGPLRKIRARLKGKR